MVDPQSTVGQAVSGNEESENNDESLGSYESPSDPCPSVKRKQLNVLINFYSCSIVNNPLHSFLRIPFHVEVLKVYFLLRMKQL
jgi:hypothetical protein